MSSPRANAPQTGRRFPDLPDGAGRAVEPVDVDGLDRVDDQQRRRAWPAAAAMIASTLVAREDRDADRRDPLVQAQAMRAQVQLGGRFLARSRTMTVRLPRQPPHRARPPRSGAPSVDLPMPGSPPSSTRRPATSPPPSTRSTSSMPTLRRGARPLPTSARRSAGPTAARGDSGAPATRDPAARRDQDGLDERVPGRRSRDIGPPSAGRRRRRTGRRSGCSP